MHTHATTVQRQKSESRLTLVEVNGVRRPVSLLFPAVREYEHNRQLVTQDASSHDAPLRASFSLLAPLNHNPLSWSATWVMTTPGTLSPQCHFCHWISCWLQPCISCLLFPAHILTLNCLENRKAVEAAMKKKKENRSRSWKAEKKMFLNVSYATISIPLTHFFWRRHSSAQRSGYSCLETIAGVLVRQLLSYCKADAFFSRQSI